MSNPFAIWTLNTQKNTDSDDDDNKVIQSFGDTPVKKPTKIKELKEAEDQNKEVRDQKLDEEKEELDKQLPEDDNDSDWGDTGDDFGGDTGGNDGGGFSDTSGENDFGSTSDNNENDSNNDEQFSSIDSGSKDDDNGDKSFSDTSGDKEDNKNSTDTNPFATANASWFYRYDYYSRLAAMEEYGTPGGVRPNPIWGQPDFEDAADAAILDNSIQPTEGSGEDKQENDSSGDDDDFGDDFGSGGDADTGDDFGDTGSDTDTGDDSDSDSGDNSGEGDGDWDFYFKLPKLYILANENYDEDVDPDVDDTEDDEYVRVNTMYWRWYLRNTGIYPANLEFLSNRKYLASTERVDLWMTNSVKVVLGSKILRELIAEGLSILSKLTSFVAKKVYKYAALGIKQGGVALASYLWAGKFWNVFLKGAIAMIPIEALTISRVTALPCDVWLDSAKIILFIDDRLKDIVKILAIKNDSERSTATDNVFESIESKLDALGITVAYRKNTIKYRNWLDKRTGKNLKDLGYTPDKVNKCAGYLTDLSRICKREKLSKQSHRIAIQAALTNTLTSEQKALAAASAHGAKINEADFKKSHAHLYTRIKRVELISELYNLEITMAKICAKDIETVFKEYRKAYVKYKDDLKKDHS